MAWNYYDAVINHAILSAYVGYNGNLGTFDRFLDFWCSQVSNPSPDSRLVAHLKRFYFGNYQSVIDDQSQAKLVF